MPPARGLAPVLARAGVPADRVVRLAAAHARDGESLADLDRLHRLDAHQRLREHPVDASIPVHVRTEPRRHAVAEHFDHSAERVSGLGGLFDLANHVGLGVGVEAAHLRAVDLREIVRRRTVRDRRGGRAELDDVAQNRRSEMTEERFGDRSGRDAGGSFARRGALEDVAGVVEGVLLHSCEIGVPRAGLRQRRRRATGCRRHLVGPLAGRPLAVADQDRDRAAERTAVPYAPEELDVVGLEAHPRTAAVTQSTPRELACDIVDEDGQTGGQALDGDHQRRSVGLARRQEPQHGASWGGGAVSGAAVTSVGSRDSTAVPVCAQPFCTPPAAAPVAAGGG